jgi:hypothetical protein
MKGTGDRLSNKQFIWLSQPSSWGYEVEVCRVKAVPVIKTREKRGRVLQSDDLHLDCSATGIKEPVCLRTSLLPSLLLLLFFFRSFPLSFCGTNYPDEGGCLKGRR